ncbi:hypothetical protein SAMN05518871_107157 [Psychrobacillus sp. OK028]|nr:hypothetical protein SAMN05518871_107157 [Psychrobacillus sp. OK028]
MIYTPVELAVYENGSMTKIIKKIGINALTNQEKMDFYVTKQELKRIRKEIKPGYIHVIENKKVKKSMILKLR